MIAWARAWWIAWRRVRAYRRLVAQRHRDFEAWDREIADWILEGEEYRAMLWEQGWR